MYVIALYVMYEKLHYQDMKYSTRNQALAFKGNNQRNIRLGTE